MLNSPKSLACLSAEKQVDDCQFKLSKNLISNFNFLTEQLKKEVFSTENKNNCLYFLLSFIIGIESRDCRTLLVLQSIPSEPCTYKEAKTDSQNF